MVIDCLHYRIADSKTLCLLKDNQLSDIELRLFFFWARHPHAKLSLYTIANAVDTARINLRDAIESLVTKAILIERENSEDDLITYSLSDSVGIQECIEEISRMDWNQIKLLELQLQGETISY
jgi:hypothetical protein